MSARAQGTGGGRQVLRLSPESGVFSSDIVTIQSSTGTIYAGYNSTKAEFRLPVQLPNYTATALTAITGQVGWMAAVNNSSGGGNPNGMIAFWDTTHSRWSYIHDNSAV